MRKILVLAILCFILGTQQVYAHPPSKITADYDPSGKTLTVVISHEVRNPTEHFIKKVEVKLNGIEIIEQKISRQDNNDTQSVSYIIPDAQSGDTIKVVARCSLSGKLAQELKVALSGATD